ncbi:hypothetical protein ACYZFV_18090 [Serratia ureilytica]
MRKPYQDEYDKELEYRNWLRYRESSYEDKADRAASARQSSSVPAPPHAPGEPHSSTIFRKYPEHEAMVRAAERKYFESLRNEDAREEPPSEK